ncbi:hypothetical protein EMIHUDRAFT_78467, partial [Emiliania huxleyi CCMP1516]|uniref:Uncharacterized protein n=2 Tax=Emiliania huxleyi TaxID=2903 RepID=A0A0D3J4X5_EMIH1
QRAWQRAGRELAERWQSGGRELAERWQRGGRELAESWQSGGRAVAESCLGDPRQSETVVCPAGRAAPLAADPLPLLAPGRPARPARPPARPARTARMALSRSTPPQPSRKASCLPISPHISPHLLTSPHMSSYLLTSPHISATARVGLSSSA